MDKKHELQIIKQARHEWERADYLEIKDNAPIDEDDGGVWVQAWVFISPDIVRMP